MARVSVSRVVLPLSRKPVIRYRGIRESLMSAAPLHQLEQLFQPGLIQPGADDAQAAGSRIWNSSGTRSKWSQVCPSSQGTMPLARRI